jgi:hypothetical protein
MPQPLLGMFKLYYYWCFENKFTYNRDEASLITEEIEEIEFQIREQEERAAALENKIQRTDEIYRREKELYENAVSAHTKEAKDLEDRLLQCRDTGIEDAKVSAASRRVADARARRTLNRDNHLRARKELMEAIMEAVTRCADHRYQNICWPKSFCNYFIREMVEKRQAEIREMYSQTLESLLARQFSTSSSPYVASTNLISKDNMDVVADTEVSEIGRWDRSEGVSSASGRRRSSRRSAADMKNVSSELKRSNKNSPQYSQDDFSISRNNVATNLEDRIEQAAKDY